MSAPYADPGQPEIQPQIALQSLPEEADDGFEPLATCPPEERDRWMRRAEKADRQPLKAIEMKCLECSAWDHPVAKACEIRSCPLWAFNRRIFGRVAIFPNEPKELAAVKPELEEGSLAYLARCARG